jgi:outer membrane protein OmpA-like peptidoglycan-associated protein
LAADDDYYGEDSEQPGEGYDELSRLNALHDDLVEAVQTAINPTVRADLAAELRSVRERIAELSRTDSEARRGPDPGHTVHSYEVPQTPADAASSTADGGYGGGYDADPYVSGSGYQQQPAYDPDPYGAGSGYQQQPAYDPTQAYQPGVDGGYGQGGPWDRGPVPGIGPDGRPRASLGMEQQQQPRQSFWSGKPWLPLALAILGGLALAAVIGFGGLLGGDDGGGTEVADGEADPAGVEAADAAVADIRSVLDGMGLSAVAVEQRDGTITLTGTVATAADRDAAIGAATALAGDLPFDASGLVVSGEGGTEATAPVVAVGEADAMQRELNRVLAATPIIFESGQTAVTERHQRILNNIVSTMAAYPNLKVTIVGYTDDQGSDLANEQLSLARAQNVKDYLVGQGVPAENLDVRAVGEQDASGSAQLANLERRVEFEVTGAAGSGVVPSGDSLRVAVVAPSARNDLAFTQSMVDAVNIIGEERPIEVAITDNTFVPEDAAAAIADYAAQGYDLVIAHGSQFGTAVLDIAPQYPDVAFAWGTASDTFGLPNVYAYDAKAQQGGYVLGAVAGLLSSGTIGVVGPIEVGDAALYVNGFEAGAKAERPGANVIVAYTGSFSDLGLAAEEATKQIDAGADVMTG